MTVTTRPAPTLAMLREKRAEILALAEQYGAYNVRVFGSVARGEATPESDIDLLVTFKAGTSLYELAGLWQAIGELLGHEINLLSDGNLRQRLREAIEGDLVWL